ncbi:16S rRNA (cytidine(1402)-2'-O)-methyltransferase [Olsenella sp. HMSC062G07]|uniref:16S rRNA (cytidine(1402)-2'-O)-methyltransferase n=1 Tax=Olsenella sp. HMSC062G07 TaxID=1739330 RepID=UPI000A8EBB64
MSPVAQAPDARLGVLSMVGTPIGNLEDVSPRVRRTLGEAQIVLCEDTRVTARLLTCLGLKAQLVRADENTLEERVGLVLERVAAGCRVAFVSDAGMPGVSDPGQRLVDAVLDAGLPVEVIPGPSAVTCALVASGLPMDHFFFEGFLPRKQGALKARLTELATIPGALVVYESPRRVSATLCAIAQLLPQRRVALVRELTKLHEECARGLAPELAAGIAERPTLRGECVIVIAGPSPDELSARRAAARQEALPLEEALRAGVAAGEPKSSLARRLAKTYGMSRGAAYDLVIAATSKR